MKTIVYPNGSIQQTAWAEAHVASGYARYATPEEIASCEKHFETFDQGIREASGSSMGYSHACGYHD